MNNPNFLIVGAAKCGTTALDGYLKQHPEIFLPEVKECRYFSDVKNNNTNPFTQQKHANFISNSEEYFRLFHAATSKVRGDNSPDYLYYHKSAIPRIKTQIGADTKIIIMLRNPVQRAFSNYLHILREGYDSMDMNEFMDKEKAWIEEGVYYGFHLTQPGYYHEAVKGYMANFSNIKVIIFEEFINDVGYHLKEICSFLEIDTTFDFKEPAFKNKTGLPKHKWIDLFVKHKSPVKSTVRKLIAQVMGEQQLRDRLYKIKESNLEKPNMNKGNKEFLKKLYHSDIKKLEVLLDKKVSHLWC